VLNAAGEPTHLVTGVVEAGGAGQQDRSWTLVQPLATSPPPPPRPSPQPAVVEAGPAAGSARRLEAEGEGGGGGGGGSGGKRRRAQLLKERWGTAEKALQRASAQLLASEFGPAHSPRRIEMVLRLPGSSSTSTLEIEMAADTLMPVTVLYFLRQVRAGLWDGTEFHRNAHHVLQAGPGKHRRAFMEAGCASRLEPPLSSSSSLHLQRVAAAGSSGDRRPSRSTRPPSRT
jgi:hypothetical protein